MKKNLHCQPEIYAILQTYSNTLIFNVLKHTFSEKNLVFISVCSVSCLARKIVLLCKQKEQTDADYSRSL